MKPLVRLAAALSVALASALVALPAVSASDVFQQATAAPSRPVDARFFGIHASYLVPVPGRREGRATRWPDLPIGGFRLWDAHVRWADIAPARGKWQWERFDSLVSEVSGHGADLMYTLGSTPRWASARPDEACPYGQGCSAEPADMLDWEDYVRSVARRYKGRIKVYEVWNEPKFYDPSSPAQGNGGRPRGFFSGSVDNMVEMARIARRVLKEEDPQARLATPGFDGGAKWLEMFLAAGGRSLVDIIAYHFYARGAEDFAAQIVTVRGVMKRQGVSQLPLWNTESGFESDDGKALAAGAQRKPDATDTAALLTQTLVIAAAAGIERFYAYAWDNPQMGMVDAEGRALPSLAAYRRAQGWLAGATWGPCHQAEAGVVACEGQRSGQRVTIAWANEGRREWRPAPPSAQRLGSAQAVLGDEIRSQGQDADALPPSLQIGKQPMLLNWNPR